MTRNSSWSRLYALCPRAGNSSHVGLCGNAFEKICPLRCPVEREAREERRRRKRYRQEAGLARAWGCRGRGREAGLSRPPPGGGASDPKGGLWRALRSCFLVAWIPRLPS